MLRGAIFRYAFMISYLGTLSSCALVRNDPGATCNSSNGVQILRLTGYRDNKTHSLIMFALRPSVPAHTEFVVPALVGLIPGAVVRWSEYPNAKLGGSIIFKETKATVDLYLQPKPDSTVPLDWNGTYEIHQPCTQSG